MKARIIFIICLLSLVWPVIGLAQFEDINVEFSEHFDICDYDASDQRVIALSSTKIVVAYTDCSEDKNIGKARVGTINYNQITWGPETTFYSQYTEGLVLIKLSSSKFAIIFLDQKEEGKSYHIAGYGIIGTVVDDVITYGPVSSKFNEFRFNYVDATPVGNSNVVVAFKCFASDDEDEEGQNHVKAVIGQVNGSALTWGSVQVISEETTAYNPGVAYLDTDTCVFTYPGNDAYAGEGFARVAQVSSTTLILGDQKQMHGNGEKYDLDSVYTLSPTRFIASEKEYYYIGDVEGSTITWPQDENQYIADSNKELLIPLTSERVIAFQGSYYSKGYLRVFQVGSDGYIEYSDKIRYWGDGTYPQDGDRLTNTRFVFVFDWTPGDNPGRVFIATVTGFPVEPCDCPDTDGDGIVDAWDTCADTPAGSYVDKSGCPAPAARRKAVVIPLTD